MTIPKIIIQTWKCKDLPPYYKKTQNIIFRNNPEYRYIFFDDDDILKFVRDRYPSFESLLAKFKRKIQIIDFFRLLAIYEYGGFYFDMDVEVIKNLDPLLDNSCVFPVEMKRNNRILDKMGYDFNIGNYAFGATPKNPVIWEIIQEIVRVMDDPHRLIGSGMHPKLADMISEVTEATDTQLAHEYVYHTTGPVLVSKVVFEKLAEGESIKLLYPKNWPSRSSWFRFGEYAKHTMTGTWKPDQAGIINSDLNSDLDSDMKNASMAEEIEPEKQSYSVLNRIYEGFGLQRVLSSVSVEHMTVSDMVSDPETVMILVLSIGIIIILMVLCSLSLIGCDEEVVIV